MNASGATRPFGLLHVRTAFASAGTPWEWAVRMGTVVVLMGSVFTGLGHAATAAKPSQAVSHAALPPLVQQALAKTKLPAHALAVAVMPLDAEGTARAQRQPGLAPQGWRHGADQPVNPASVMKLVTTYAALDLLGPQFVWHTRFWADGVVQGGLLRGNLHVQGGGDPKFVMERITDALAQVRASGVTAIHGDLVLDQSLFQLPRTDPGGFDGERLRPYNAKPEALLVNFKSVILQFEPDVAKGVARVQYEPPLAGVTVDATVPMDASPCADWRSRLAARFDAPDTIRFAGSFPQKCGPQTWPVAYVEPDAYAARALEGLWRSGGGALTGQVRLGPVPATAKLLVNAPSLPLADIVQDVNKFSNNVMAQQVFLTLGLLPPAAPASGAATSTPMPVTEPTRELVGPTNFERARTRVGQWWQQRLGAQAPAPVLDNGSGLSREERITPDALVALLRDAARHSQAGPVLMQSLPIAGVDGTARRMGERGVLQQAVGQARVKTGSLRDVASVAGYVQSRSGRQWAVAAIIHHPQAQQSRAVLDAVLEWTASQKD